MNPNTPDSHEPAMWGGLPISRRDARILDEYVEILDGFGIDSAEDYTYRLKHEHLSSKFSFVRGFRKSREQRSKSA